MQLHVLILYQWLRSGSATCSRSHKLHLAENMAEGLVLRRQDSFPQCKAGGKCVFKFARCCKCLGAEGVLQQASQTGQRRSALAARNVYIRQHSSGLTCAPRGPERFFYDASSYTGSRARRLPEHFSKIEDSDLRKGLTRMSPLPQHGTVALRPSSLEGGRETRLDSGDIPSALPILLGSTVPPYDEQAKRRDLTKSVSIGTRPMLLQSQAPC